MELEPYTPLHRDEIEDRLAQEANKLEIHYESRQGLEITVYYLRKLGQVSLCLSESGNIREFIIPSDLVNDAISHPELYAHDAGMPRHITRPYQAGTD